MPTTRHHDPAVDALDRERLRKPDEFARSFEETYRVRFAETDADAGYALLASVGQVTALPNETYVVGSVHLMLLDGAGIRYELV